MQEAPPKQQINGSESVNINNTDGLPQYNDPNLRPNGYVSSQYSYSQPPPETGYVALRRQEMSGDAATIMKVFEGYMEAERQRSAKRTFAIIAIFVGLLLVVILGFFVMWFSTVRGMQNTQTALITAALTKDNSAPQAAQPTAVQAPTPVVYTEEQLQQAIKAAKEEAAAKAQAAVPAKTEEAQPTESPDIREPPPAPAEEKKAEPQTEAEKKTTELPAQKPVAAQPKPEQPKTVKKKPEAKPEAKPETKPVATKPKAKPEPKPVATKPKAKSEPKPEVKPEPKPEPKPEAKPAAAKPEPKPESKPQAQKPKAAEKKETKAAETEKVKQGMQRTEVRTFSPTVTIKSTPPNGYKESAVSLNTGVSKPDNVSWQILLPTNPE